MPEGQRYNVAVAFMPIDQLSALPHAENQRDDGTVPGFENTIGRKDLYQGTRLIIERGEQTVLAATDAIAGQIGDAAARIAKAVRDKAEAMLDAGDIGMERIDISFGITLSAGMTTLFTAQGESSVRVTLRLSPRASAAADDDDDDDDDE